MRFKVFTATVLLVSATFTACSQTPADTVKTPKPTTKWEWKHLADGADFIEIDAPLTSKINDSKISILKIDPAKADFYMLSATEHGKKSLPADLWADSFGMNVVINAGMYDLAHKLLSKGFLQNGKHFNNASLYPNYNAMIAFNPKDSTDSKFTVFDLKCTEWNSVKSDYSCYAQGLRMIDCEGKALEWNKKKQSCSMLVTALGKDGNIYFIFCRSPYSHNEMIGFMLGFPFGLTHAIYMEGGPQTSLYVNIGETKIEKIGSYVSETYANDLNDHFWKLPNVIGIKLK